MIFGAFERTVAFRYLRARRQEGFVSVIAGFSLAGIALGVATLIIVMAVMNGFRADLLDRILGVQGHITVYPRGQHLENHAGLAERLRAIDGVVSAQPQVRGQVMASSDGRSTGAVVRGMTRADLAERALIAGNVEAGSLDAFDGERVLMGADLARNLGVRRGGDVTLISPRGQTTAMGTVPRVRSFPAGALFDVGMHEYDSRFIYMPMEAAQRFFKTGDAVSAIEIFVADPDAVGPLRRDIATDLGADYYLTDWKQANASFFNAIEVERNVMFLILTLIILVAAFNIITGQIMLVKDKGGDIAILRTMGATRGMILRIFMLSGASIGVIGTAIGFTLGLAFAKNIEAIRQGLQQLTGTELFAEEIYFLSTLPAKVDSGETAAVVVMALALSLLASVYPAWRAARMAPVEALRDA